MKKYCEYKNSCISWIGEIPGHWELKRNKSFMSMTGYKAGENADLYILLSLTINGVIARDIESGKGKFPKDFDDYQVVKKDELIFCLFDIDETPRTVGLVNTEGMITGAYTALKVNKEYALPKYIYYYYLCVDNIKALRPYYSGLRKTIRSDKFLQLYIPLPPIKEQLVIVSYIDEKTAKIDEYIDKKNKEIEALKEWKKALIAHVVTKGLNTNAKMKDSGVSWIGDIPEHWDIRKMKYTFTERSEKNHPDEQILCATQNQGVIPQTMYSNRVVVVNKGFENLKFVKKGDFVISLRSFQGGIEYAYYQGIISAAYTILYPNKIIDSEYAKHLLKSHQFIELLKTCVTGIREGQNINYDLLRKKYLPIPPIEEQQEIVEYIDAATTKADKMIVELTNHVESMKEYKQRLIADVVTGKINVQP